jgi:hypothetical protein
MRNGPRIIAALLVAVLAMPATRAGALKFRTYTLPELVRAADAVVVARIEPRSDGVHAHVLRVLRGEPGTDVRVESTAIREQDRVRFTAGETAILFLRAERQGSRPLIGYGDQGKWPRTSAAWPFAKVHVVPLAKVERAVRTIQSLDAATGGGVRRRTLAALLGSKDDFDQAYGLEYLDATDDRELREALRPEIETVRRTAGDRYLRALGESVERAGATEPR